MTRKREIAGCLSAVHATGCKNVTLITAYQSEIIETKGITIRCIPAWEWMLDNA
ncbi:MAG: hypothetical protein HUK14_06870 [Muribaculaceae bacterium]|nr:hypothetical protein [Muribaculaceae bacterium]